tara:strand:- start:2828 stop:3493 length:666 start_codon:yes stop_codon:yes gene_type:complete
MKISTFTNLIQFPEKIQKSDLQDLDKLCEKYPFCSSLHKLRLKGLKASSSNRYNDALKLTAALSRNRTMLFNFISENSFDLIKEKSEIIKNKETSIVSNSVVYDNSDMYSFSEWLKLSTLQPITRIEKTNSLEKKMKKIGEFIEYNNSKDIPKKEFFSPKQMVDESSIENNYLMTETLAKIYLEQGHYQKAITAYEILSLKYPQKSSLFADQIKAIKLLNH